MRQEDDDKKLDDRKALAEDYDKEMKGEKEAENEEQKAERKAVGKALKAQE